MDRIFRKNYSYTRVFFDDIIVYSKTLEKHKEHLAKVFQELKEHKLYVNSKKSFFVALAEPDGLSNAVAQGIFLLTGACPGCFAMTASN